MPSNCFWYVSSNTFYDKKQYLLKFSTNDIIFDFIYVKNRIQIFAFYTTSTTYYVYIVPKEVEFDISFNRYDFLFLHKRKFFF